MHIMNEFVGKRIKKKTSKIFVSPKSSQKNRSFIVRTFTVFAIIGISTYPRRRDCTKMNRIKETHSHDTFYRRLNADDAIDPPFDARLVEKKKSFAIYSFSLYHRTDNRIILSHGCLSNFIECIRNGEL